MIPSLCPSQSSLDRLDSFGNYWIRLCGLAANAPDEIFAAQASDICWYFAQDYTDPIGTPHPWQNLSPAMMRVPHLAQKFEARPGTGAGACARGP